MATTLTSEDRKRVKARLAEADKAEDQQYFDQGKEEGRSWVFDQATTREIERVTEAGEWPEKRNDLLILIGGDAMEIDDDIIHIDDPKYILGFVTGVHDAMSDLRRSRE